jgi:DNA-directed RNA polymerase specialized sigma24 family protein
LTERRDIGSRLENWARVYRDTQRQGISPTAAYCDQLRRDALGDTSASPERRKIDEEDARLIETGMREIPRRQAEMLRLCYIDQADPNKVCRRMSIPHRPSSTFVSLFRAAQAAIEAAVEPRNTFHNSCAKFIDNRESRH